MFENVVIGKPIVGPLTMFAYNVDDWNFNECDKTLFTKERFLPKIMVECGIVKSISEVKRNQPKFCIKLEKLDFLDIKWGKKHLFIEVGI